MEETNEDMEMEEDFEMKKKMEGKMEEMKADLCAAGRRYHESLQD